MKLTIINLKYTFQNLSAMNLLTVKGTIARFLYQINKLQ